MPFPINGFETAQKKQPEYPTNPVEIIVQFPSFTEERRKIIIAAVKKGLPFSYACKKAKITPETGYKWVDIGQTQKEQGLKSPFVTFFEDIGEADSEYLEKLVEGFCIYDNPKVALEVASRRYKKEFGKKEVIEHSGEIKTTNTIEDKRERLNRIARDSDDNDNTES